MIKTKACTGGEEGKTPVTTAFIQKVTEEGKSSYGLSSVVGVIVNKKKAFTHATQLRTSREVKKKHLFSRFMHRLAGRFVMCSKTRVSSRVWSGGVGNLTGRLGSGQEVFKHYGTVRITLAPSDDPREGIRPMKNPQKKALQSPVLGLRRPKRKKTHWYTVPDTK